MSRKRGGRKKDAGDVRPSIQNRQARFRYELFDRFEAGLVLLGSEVKSIRSGGVELKEAWIRVTKGEAWLVDCRVNPYSHATQDAPDPARPRKLLLHQREIQRLQKAIQERGLTVVPTSMYFKGSRVKLEIALARGKKLHDKREAVKRRDEERRARASVDV